MKAVILGAGPCGLTAAWELSRNGVNVTIVEKNAVVGGLCRTTRRDGYSFDLGGHRFISGDQNLVDDINALMGGRLLLRDRKSVIRFRNREYEYPVNLTNILSQSTPLMSLNFTLGYVAATMGLARSSAPEGSFELWIDQRFGRPLNEFFFKPYTEKLWGIPTSQLSSEWASQRISLLDAKDAVLKSMRLSRKTPRTYARKYYYPPGGIGEIFDVMAEEIIKHGGEIITGASPTKLEVDSGRVRHVVIKNRDGEPRPITGDYYLSTIPLDELTALIEPISSPLPYRALRFLNITLKGLENLSDNTWIYTPEKDIIMTRVQEPKRRSPHNAPPDETSVMLEIPCEAGDRVWSMPDERLLDKALKDLRKLSFDIAPHITGYFSTYAEKAYPRYELGYNVMVGKMRKVVQRVENLSTLGRQGLFRYIFMDNAMLMGRRWACRVLKEQSLEGIDEIGDEGSFTETNSVTA